MIQKRKLLYVLQTDYETFFSTNVKAYLLVFVLRHDTKISKGFFSTYMVVVNCVCTCVFCCFNMSKHYIKN